MIFLRFQLYIFLLFISFLVLTEYIIKLSLSQPCFKTLYYYLLFNILIKKIYYENVEIFKGVACEEIRNKK